MSGPPDDSTPEEQFAWWLARAEAGDGEAMIELAECFERGRGTPKSVDEAVLWNARATRAGVALAPALTGETIFEHHPVAGLVWLMLGLERTAEGSELTPVFVSSLSVHGERVSDEAIQAAQVWADACRELGQWPDEVPMPAIVPEPFKRRPPPPPDLPRRARTRPTEGRPLVHGGWQLFPPEQLQWQPLLGGLHLRASRDALTLHVVAARLAPGVDLDAYVRRSIASSARLWQPRRPAERFLLDGLDTFSIVLDGAGPSTGQRALKRFSAIDDRVAVLTAVTTDALYEQTVAECEALFDSLGNADSSV